MSDCPNDLGSDPTPIAIAYRAEQLEMLPQAVSDIRQVLAKPGCSWQEFWNVAQEYEVIKQDYWAELTSEETDLITALQNTSTEPDTISVGSIVAHADPYRTLWYSFLAWTYHFDSSQIRPLRVFTHNVIEVTNETRY